MSLVCAALFPEVSKHIYVPIRVILYTYNLKKTWGQKVLAPSPNESKTLEKHYLMRLAAEPSRRVVTAQEVKVRCFANFVCPASGNAGGALGWADCIPWSPSLVLRKPPWHWLVSKQVWGLFEEQGGQRSSSRYPCLAESQQRRRWRKDGWTREVVTTWAFIACFIWFHVSVAMYPAWPEICGEMVPVVSVRGCAKNRFCEANTK